MKKQSVSSSNLNTVGYDKKTKKLRISFNSGGIYEYKDVSETQYNNLLKAKSHGIYFNDHIKHNYPFSRLS